MNYSSLLLEVKEKIAVITLNRPDKLNCLDQTGWKELRQALKEGDDHPGVEVQIITGAGRAFCAGDDISLLTQVSDIDLCKDLMLDCIYELTHTILHLQKPLIAAVNGYAYGGGCELVLLSDLAVASEKALFAQPEGRIGAWPMIAATFGPLLLGNKHINELIMLGEPISADKALAMGLVNRVVPPENVMPAAREMASQVMKSSPVSLKIIKETSVKMLGERLYDFWISQIRSVKEVSRTEDFVEGAVAFMEKRPPRFKGQ